MKSRVRNRKKLVVLISTVMVALLLIGPAIASMGSGMSYLEVWNAIFGLQSKVDDLQNQIDEIELTPGPPGPPGPPGGLSTPNYDSGWVDITDMAGKDFTLTHNLHSTDIIVDITGKIIPEGGAHQRHLGLTGYISGFEKAYGGRYTDIGYSMVQTADGGYTIAGTTGSFGGAMNVYLVNTDASGTMRWNKTYGGTGSDYAWSLIQTTDGGYATAGYTYSFGAGPGRADVYLVKTDAAGTMQWNKTYGGTNEDIGRSVVQTVDLGYAISGFTNSTGAGLFDVYLIKTDAAGNMLWDKTYGGTGIDQAGYSMVKTADGGYAIAGLTYSFGAGYQDVYLIKTAAESGLAWIGSTADTITLYRGETDIYWNYVRVRIWKTD